MPNDSLDSYLDPPSAPRTRTPKQPIDLIAEYESGGRNIHQNVVPAGGGYNPSVGRVTGPSSAQGPWQITNTTWRRYAPRAGAGQFKRAMEAPVTVQRKVAQTIFDNEGYAPWAPYNPRLRAALRRGEGGQQQPKSDLDSYLDPVEQTPPPANAARIPTPSASPRQSRATSAPRDFWGRVRGRMEAGQPAPSLEGKARLLRQFGTTKGIENIQRQQAAPITSIADLRQRDEQAIRQQRRQKIDQRTGQLGLTDLVTGRRDPEAERQARVSQTGWGEYLSQVPKSAALGVTDSLAEGLKSIGVLSRKLNLFGEYEGKEASDLATYRAGEYIQKQARELVGSNPDLEQEFFVGKTPSTIGQAASFMLGGWATKSPKLAVVVMGGGLTAADAYDEVKQAGGTEDDAIHAGLLSGALLGPTELIGMRRLTKLLEGTAGKEVLEGGLRVALREGRRDALENAVQEVAQEYLQGKITGQGRSAKELLEAAALGGIAGQVGTTGLSLATQRRGRATTQTRSPRDTTTTAETSPPPRGAIPETRTEPTPGVRTEILRDQGVVRGVDPTIERYLDEPQVQTKPPVEAQRAEAESAAVGTVQPAPQVERPQGAQPTTGAVLESAERMGEVSPAESPARFYHRDYGEVEVTPSQSKAGRGRVKVVDGEGQIHYVKRADLSGRGNQRMVPIRPEPQPDVGEAGDVRSASSSASSVTKPVTEPESTTSARKAQMAADRAALDLPELPDAQRKSWQQSLNEAKPERATLLADEVLTKPRSLNDSETASLVVRAQQVKNEHAAKMREIGESSDPNAISQRRSEVEALEREFDRLTQATKLSGTEKGRTLAAQKLTINQDYDLVSLVQRAKAAKGRELTPEERTRYEQQSARISELEQQLEQAEIRASEQQLNKEIRRASRQRQRAESKQQLDTEFAELKSQLAQIKAQTTEGFFRSERGALDPEAAKVVAKMLRNRVRAGVTDAAQIVDDVHVAVSEHLPDATKRDVRDALSGYGRESKPSSDEAKELSRIRGELKRLSAQEDVAAGKRLSPADARRQTQLRKREQELNAKLAAGDFQRHLPRERPAYTVETLRLEKQVEELKAKFDRELRRVQRGRLGYAWNVAVNVANVPKTLKSIGDISALLRQGGFYSLTHPVLSSRAAVDMFRSLSEVGFKNVEHAIKTHADFDLAKRSGVEFTGVDKESIPLSQREEAFISNLVSNLPIAKQSEQTFVAFLDSQRMRVFEQFADELRSRGLTPQKNPDEFRAIAKLINIGTGRGSLGKRGNQIAPALNVLMFSPRLLASRVQLLNKMVNPVAVARMPPEARKRMVKDNVKFAATIATALALAAAAGAKVSTDPDDADFLKIRIGNTRYDILTGLQQPMRFIYRMSRAVEADVRQDETYAGEEKGPIIGRFARSKASPIAGTVTDYLTGEDFQGRRFKLSREMLDLVVPLYVDDFREAMKEYGPAGAAARTAPALVGIGAQTYKDSPEKPRTPAEKLARKKFTAKMPDEAREEEQIEVDQQKADLRARSRRGEDVSGAVAALKGKITDRQAKAILAARNKSRLQEDVTKLGIKDALLVYSVANSQQRAELKSLLEKKAPLADVLYPSDRDAVRAKLSEYGISRSGRPARPSRESRPSRAER